MVGVRLMMWVARETAFEELRGLQLVRLHGQWSQRLPTRQILASLSSHKMFGMLGRTLMQSRHAVNAFLNLLPPASFASLASFFYPKGLLIGTRRQSSLAGRVGRVSSLGRCDGLTECALHPKCLPAAGFACSLDAAGVDAAGLKRAESVR